VQTRWHDWSQGSEVEIPAKADYAIRALLGLAAQGGGPLPGASLADEQQIPAKFLEAILGELRRAGIVTSRRGKDGGYRLNRPASEITLADVIRAIDGPLAEVRGERPEATSYDGAAVHLGFVWIAVRVALRNVLERTSLADVVSGKLPANVRKLLDDPEAWQPH
jgi:Rrf2 family protein